MVPELLSGSGIIVPDPDAAKKIKEQRNEKELKNDFNDFKAHLFKRHRNLVNTSKDKQK